MGKATQKMIDFAEAIAVELGIKQPDYNDYGEVSMFIDDNKDDYYQSLRD